MTTYYVYAYIRSKTSLTASIGTPYYIGKGIGQRAFTKHNCPVPIDKTNILFIKENLTEIDAHLLEIQLIEQYGRKDLGNGILHNRTNGGEGISNPSSTTREKMATAKRNESNDTRLKRSIAAKNRIRAPLSNETKRKISEANTGKKRTDDAKLKQSVAKKGRTWEDIFGSEEAARRRDILASDEVKLKMSIAACNRSDEGAANIAEANRKIGILRKEANNKLKGV